MKNEEFQELVLRELTDIKDKVGGIEGRVAGIEGRVAGIEGRVAGIEGRVAGIETIQKDIQNNLNRLETRMERVEVRQDEIYQVVKAIEHSNQVGRSETDSQSLRLAGVEGKLKKVAGVLSE
ncbi:MAG: hypothetical protein BWY65_01497 [Firmicutes bacterium ADurb.Bin373]|nr:MAG: hypothetical protein BWY65_01497 [Firmicutes bacterium ADurb.Bin373]